MWIVQGKKTKLTLSFGLSDYHQLVLLYHFTCEVTTDSISLALSQIHQSIFISKTPSLFICSFLATKDQSRIEYWLYSLFSKFFLSVLIVSPNKHHSKQTYLTSMYVEEKLHGLKTNIMFDVRRVLLESNSRSAAKN